MATQGYPLPVFHFQVDWGGTRIGFTEASGMSLETQIIEYREGSMKEYNVTKMPGMQQFGNITLKRGQFAGDNEFYDWWNTVKLNTIERRDITVSLLNENHEPVITWKVKNAWPVKIDGPTMNSTGNETSIESMELAHEGLTVQFN
ncbi:MAG: phage tail protein [Bacteroidota bacterium]